MVPVRGGSKGVLRKNLRAVSGHPLTKWSIRWGQESKYLNSVVVSSDDDEMAQIANLSGAIVVKRPSELATDTSQTELSMTHTLEMTLGDGSDSLVGNIANSPYIWKSPTSDASPQYNVAQWSRFLESNQPL